MLVVVVAAAALAGMLQQAAAFVVVVPGCGLFVPRQQQGQQQGQQRLSSAWHATPYRARSAAAAAARASTAAVTPDEAAAGGKLQRRSLDELLTEIGTNAGTPQVLSLLKEAVAATGTGEVKREFFKVHPYAGCGWALQSIDQGETRPSDTLYTMSRTHPPTQLPPQAIFPFPLDDFQLKALEALGRRENVIVSAPTGSGPSVRPSVCLL